MGGCCYSCLKFLVIIFNLIYMLLGLALLGTTLWILMDDSMLSPMSDEIGSYINVLYFFMVVAAIMTIMGFLGCCGAFQESQWMLATFFVLVLVLFVGQIAAGGWLYQNHDKFPKLLEKSIAESIQNSYGVDEVKTKAFDVMQVQMKCCGAAGPSDWAESRYNNADSKLKLEVGVGKMAGLYKVPPSCCIESLSETECEVARALSLTGSLTQTLYTDGCSDKLMNLIVKHAPIALAVVLAIVLTEIMAMVFSMVLCCAVRRMEDFKA